MNQGSDTSGSLFFDDFESRRYSYISPMEDRGIPDPEPPIPDGWVGASYTYDRINAQPHAVLSVARQQFLGDQNPLVDSYTYDANGNMTCRYESNQGWVHTYNPNNRLSKVEKVTGDCTTHGSTTDTWTFTYDGDGVRVQEVYTNATDTITKYYFAGGAYEIVDDGTTTTTKKYYSISGMLVAMKEGANLRYLAQDHLSSTSLVMNASGGLLSHNRYMPFGEVRDITGSNDPITQTDFTYTGQRDLSGMGLMDYRARFYSPLLGRFTQPDSIVANPANPQNYNRYTYVLNNPLIFIDPSGHICLEKGRFSGGDTICSEDEDSHGWWVDTGKHCRINPEDPKCHGISDKDAEGSMTEGDVLSGTTLLPGVETIDDALTFTTGCGISCQLGYEDRVGWGWRIVAFASIFGPWGGRALRLATDGAGGYIKKVINVTDKPRTVEKFLDDAMRFIGDKYKQVSSGIYESLDGLRRVRFTDVDIAGSRSPIGPHGHFEILDTIGDVIKNIHIPFLED